MASGILTILGALVTVLGPLVTAWLTIRLDTQQEQRNHATLDEVDAHIRQHTDRNPSGLRELSAQLASLQREARRKHRPS